ncbi:zinc finger protein 37 homolog [Armigeres subalbatus]|uniref:zinc finger protein 37 homolog n=1 Tax=Armigeres subalbatus TaxID=124917 RepID=UPI002ED603B0
MAATVDISLQHVCRLCLGEESLDGIYDDDDLHRWISDYLSIKVSQQDRMSQEICTICRIRLTEFHNFRLHCQEVQTVLQSMARDDKANTGKHIPVDQACDTFVSRQHLDEHKEVHTQGGLKSDYKQITNDELTVVKTEPFEHVDLTIEPQDLKSRTESDHYLKKINHEKSELQQNPSRQGIVRVVIPHGVAKNRLPVDNAKSDGEEMMDTEELMDIEQVKIESNSDEELQLQFLPSDQPSSKSTNVNNPTTTHESSPKYKLTDSQNDDLFLLVEVDSTNSDSDAFIDDELEHEDGKDGGDGQPGNWECDVCHKIFKNRKSGWNHKQLHRPKTHICPVCGKPFGSRFLLNRHIPIHDSIHDRERAKKVEEESGPVECDVCQKVFKRRCRLYAHKRKVHGPKDQECHLCGFRFRTREQLSRHFQRHSFENEEKSKPLLQNEDDAEINDKSDEDSMQTASTSLEAKSNTDDSPKQCALCDKVFPNQYDLWRHHKYTHKKRLACELCNETFFRKDRLQKHMFEEHKFKDGSYLPMECKECDIVFETTLEYRRHKLKHTSHMCTICNETFKSAYFLKIHLSTHSEDGKSFECTICHKSFKTFQRKVIHMNVHKKYKCHTCGRKYSGRNCLLKHMKTHEEDNDASSSKSDSENEADANSDDSAEEASIRDQKMDDVNPPAEIKRRSLRVNSRKSLKRSKV